MLWRHGVVYFEHRPCLVGDGEAYFEIVLAHEGLTPGFDGVLFFKKRAVLDEERPEGGGARGDDTHVALGERAKHAIAITVLYRRVRFGVRDGPTVLGDLAAHGGRQIGAAIEVEAQHGRA